MNTSLIPARRSIFSAAIVAAASIAYLGLSQQADAAVVWLASDDGTNLTLTTDGGSFDNGALQSFSGSNFLNRADWSSDSSLVAARINGHRFLGNTGTLSGADPWIATSSLGTSTGNDFGFNGSTLIWDTAFGTTPGVFTPVTTMTFSGLTIASAFGSNLNAGPVLLWTHDTTGDTISIARATPIPEPSSAVLLGLGGLGFCLRRRR